MMKHKNAIILHGMPGKEEYYDIEQASGSNAHWLAWLQNALMTEDIFTSNPEMPLAFEPQYEIWKKEFERFDINENTLLVGHSTGAGFIVRWLSENTNITVNKVVLVAPYFDPFREIEEDFFNFEFDRQLVCRTISGITVFHSDNDIESIQKSTKQLLDNVDNIKYIEFHNYGHFCLEDLGMQEFPELLEECLKQ
jgi:predicted alpha/beta hydrolase family esterase